MASVPSTALSTGERVTRLEDAFVRIEKQVGDTNKSLERFIEDSTQYRESQLKSKQTNWFALVGAICVVLGLMFSVFIAALGALWMVITLQINSGTQPIRDQVISIQTQWGNIKRITDDSSSQLVGIVAQNATSAKDRDDIRHDINFLRDESSKELVQVTTILKDLQEQETQLKKAQDENNLQHAHSERRISEHQSALHQLGAIVPEPAIGPFYFPSVPETKK